MPSSPLSRREFVRRGAMLGAALSLSGRDLFANTSNPPFETFAYDDVSLTSELHHNQLLNTHAVLMGLDEDGLMRPFRVMCGLPAPGEDIGGWYMYKADYDYRKDSAGLCPGGTFGQWISALSRYYAITSDAATRDRVLALNRAYAKSIGSGFFQKNRFPAYCYDKLVCGLIDSHQFAEDPNAFAILNQTTDLALPELPPHAVDRELSWRPGKEGDISYNWDESYTLPENLFLAYQRGAGDRYKQLAIRFLLDKTYFEPLATGKNVFAGRHAYSYVNALNSAMQAYRTLGSEMHLRAARNAFEMLVTTQSFATGGWGPDEQLREPNAGALAASLVEEHQSFETPCGAYAHFKLTRSLLCVTRDAGYGDSMERVMYNTVLGAKPLEPDGTAFYYSDYSYQGHKAYSRHRWPCCSGTLPQIASDYHISAYFHDTSDLYVNLYVPSKLIWRFQNAYRELKLTTDYPFSEVVQLDLIADRPAEFGIYLRIPAWTKEASVSVNGKRQPLELEPGTFADLHRQWKTGDRIELHLPLTTRLEAIDPQHPDIVALMYGPLVLFPLTNTAPSVTRGQLLAATPAGPKRWQVQTATGPLTLVPFTEITDQAYTTYVRVR
ncbi:MAG TPA: beta-L-arabinofuranosidase domain-containing protein [Terriglobales bacterium]